MRYNLQDGDQYGPIELLTALKDIGFNEPCSKKISILNGRLEDCCNSTNSSLEKEYYEWISCPSIYDIAHWLRTRYDIHVEVEYDSSQLWGFTLRYCDYRDDHIDNDSMFINYETALAYGEFRAISYIKSIT